MMSLEKDLERLIKKYEKWINIREKIIETKNIDLLSAYNEMSDIIKSTINFEESKREKISEIRYFDDLDNLTKIEEVNVSYRIGVNEKDVNIELLTEFGKVNFDSLDLDRLKEDDKELLIRKIDEMIKALNLKVDMFTMFLDDCINLISEYDDDRLLKEEI